VIIADMRSSMVAAKFAAAIGCVFDSIRFAREASNYQAGSLRPR
jgi:hypothetical protein